MKTEVAKINGEKFSRSCWATSSHVRVFYLLIFIFCGSFLDFRQMGQRDRETKQMIYADHADHVIASKYDNM